MSGDALHFGAREPKPYFHSDGFWTGKDSRLLPFLGEWYFTFPRHYLIHSNELSGGYNHSPSN